MGWLAWLIFGALAGWVASMIAGTNDRQGCIVDVIVGIVGALIGGFLVQFLTGTPFDAGFNPISFIVAVGGAVLLLIVVKFVRGT